jgi:hypothetical protein
VGLLLNGSGLRYGNVAPTEFFRKNGPRLVKKGIGIGSERYQFFIGLG